MTVPLLVTTEQAKQHLRVDHDSEDEYIALCVEMASAIILNYLKIYPGVARTEYQSLPVYDPENPTPATFSPWPPITQIQQPPYWWPTTKVSYQQLPPVPDWIGSPLAPPAEIKAATLLVIGKLFEDREGTNSPISPAVESLLMRHRDPAAA